VTRPERARAPSVTPITRRPDLREGALVPSEMSVTVPSVAPVGVDAAMSGSIRSCRVECVGEDDVGADPLEALPSFSASPGALRQGALTPGCGGAGVRADPPSTRFLGPMTEVRRARLDQGASLAHRSTLYCWGRRSPRGKSGQMVERARGGRSKLRTCCRSSGCARPRLPRKRSRR
jgi:hypothetical protein